MPTSLPATGTSRAAGGMIRSICGPKAPSTTEMIPERKLAARATLYALMNLAAGEFWKETKTQTRQIAFYVEGRLVVKRVYAGRGEAGGQTRWQRDKSTHWLTSR